MANKINETICHQCQRDAKTEVYGWDDLSECGYGVISMTVDSDRVSVIPKDERVSIGELRVDCYMPADDTYSCWFDTFDRAKRAQVEYFRRERRWRADAIRYVLAQTYAE